MGPDCGTALIAGAPLGSPMRCRAAPSVSSPPRALAAGVACLIARAGSGISHAIGVGGRDLDAEIGGIATLMAIDALDGDPATEAIVIISKPPADAVARAVLDASGAAPRTSPSAFSASRQWRCRGRARRATLRDAARAGARGNGRMVASQAPAHAALAPSRRWIRGLYSGGTLCAEAQIVLRRAGTQSFSNAPIPGRDSARSVVAGHSLIDLGADEYTRGRPHAIIDPAMRRPHLAASLADPSTAVVLLDVVLGYGAHRDPAAAIVETLAAAPADRPLVIASLCGTEGDKQGYDSQRARLQAAGIVVAASNADAAELALAIVTR